MGGKAVSSYPPWRGPYTKGQLFGSSAPRRAVHYLADEPGHLREAARAVQLGRAVAFDRALTDEERATFNALLEDFR
jgi:hypothetical protein